MRSLFYSTESQLLRYTHINQSNIISSIIDEMFSNKIPGTRIALEFTAELMKDTMDKKMFEEKLLTDSWVVEKELDESNYVFGVNIAANKIALRTRRGRGNFIVKNPDFIYNNSEPYDLGTILHMYNMINDESIPKNELLIMYVGESNFDRFARLKGDTVYYDDKTLDYVARVVL